MEAQFRKLEEVALNNVDQFRFSRKQYFGPVNPTAIVTFGSDVIRVNALVLAEAVPSVYLPKPSRKNLCDAVIVHLDDNFEFRAYHPEAKVLADLNVLVGDPDRSYDGTVVGAKAFFDEIEWSFEVLYYKKELKN